MTIVVPADEAGIALAAEVLRAGGVVGVPTDTVYGLAVLPQVPGAIDALFALKQRPRTTPIAVLVSSVNQARTLGHLAVRTVGESPADSPLRRAGVLAEAFWPGALTLVVPRTPEAANLDLGEFAGTIGLRWPFHDVATALIDLVGPIATTSANVHGEPTVVTAHAFGESFGDSPVHVLDAGACGGLASTVVDCTGESGVRILREGVVAKAQIEEVLARHARAGHTCHTP